jgi:elongation factor P
MIEVSNFKKGVCLVYKDAPMVIVSVTFSTPTARGGSTIAKTKLRNLLTGQLISESIRSGAKYETVDVEQRPASYMYSDGTHWHFMEADTYEQFQLTGDELGDSVGYLVDGAEGLSVRRVNGQIIGVDLPNTIELTVRETEPVIKGATAQAQLKRAVLETGLEVQVPPYLEAGERIRVDTRDGHFVERAKG